MRQDSWSRDAGFDFRKETRERILVCVGGPGVATRQTVSAVTSLNTADATARDLARLVR
jgi:hypothetical protein